MRTGGRKADTIVKYEIRMSKSETNSNNQNPKVQKWIPAFAGMTV